MARFEYDSKVLSVEAYGKTLQLAKKTPALVEKVDAVLKAPNIKEHYQRMYDSVGDIVGTAARDEIFPALADADTDEMSDFWMMLCQLYKDKAAQIREKYQPPVKK